jgi:hypothetical protein
MTARWNDERRRDDRRLRRGGGELRTFDWSPKYLVPNLGSVIGTTLNAQGYATQYATSSVIKPQS